MESNVKKFNVEPVWMNVAVCSTIIAFMVSAFCLFFGGEAGYPKPAFILATVAVPGFLGVALPIARKTAIGNAGIKYKGLNLTVPYILVLTGIMGACTLVSIDFAIFLDMAFEGVIAAIGTGMLAILNLYATEGGENEE